tara:strand:+ start:495 stop:767 length:273 start_codon:yes stop_codon:yes gene_type:complete
MNEQELREMIRTEIKSIVAEQDVVSEDSDDAFDAKIPVAVDRFMKKFISALKDAKLNRRKRISVLGRTIAALGLTPQELMKYTRLVKKGL